MRFLLDTNIVSFALRERHGIAPRLATYRPTDLAVSTVSLAEGLDGCARLGSPGLRLWDLWQQLVGCWHVLAFCHGAAEHYARLRAGLQRRGCVIGDRDMMIAATALTHDLTLVTDNTDEFSRIPALRVDNWCSP